MSVKPVRLTGEQRKVLMLPMKGPIQIKGVAGSGKTTVALYRAKHLIDTDRNLFDPDRVILFTFNKSLSRYLDSLRRVLGSPDGDEGEGPEFEVINFHKWAWRILFEHGLVRSNGVQNGESRLNLIDSVRRDLSSKYPDAKVLEKQREFFGEEFSWMKGKLLYDKDAYIEERRAGRGKSDRVTRDDKALIWYVFEGYQQRLDRIKQVDFDDFAKLILDLSETTDLSIYSHIVVDEAQDLSKAQLKAISSLVQPHTNSLTFIADSAQRIFKSGFTWKEVGLSLAGGRTVEFKKNYRNTRPIAALALSLLAHDRDSDEFTVSEMPARDGVLPTLNSYQSVEQEISAVGSAVNDYRRNKELGSVCVLHRTQLGVKGLINCLNSHDIPCQQINGEADIDFNDEKIKVCTMSSIKGLEFEAVFIVGLGRYTIPLPAGFVDEDDELHVNTERRLLYTSMTRAQSVLRLSYSGEPSPFLAELDRSLYETDSE